ncbi:Serine protease Do-like HtrB [Gimesia chilikensis]|uniref:Serine protease Do-like HtrB n=1 Tax=Gimesia chilikensis TaxID=2605989 RepID=A0A517WIP3_9PLAN|nr:PDZ domain-containing protein [Gimesia chilikensis]QDU05127.1 Serine protease Do-like HtrB [Gimesia chilikensis]
MKQFQWFLLSGLITSLIAIQTTLADETPLQAPKPGQPQSLQQNPTLNPAPPTSPDAAGPQGKFRVTTRSTGETEMRNFVGVVTEPIPAYLEAQLHDMLTAGQGIGIKMVVPDSPAQQAGLKPFDVLTSYNGKAITSSDILRKFVLDSDKGETIQLEVIRASRKQTVELTLTQKLFRYYKFQVTPLGQKPQLADNNQKDKPKKTDTGKDAPIAARSTETDPLGRKEPLNFNSPATMSTHNLCLLFVGKAKGDYSVEVNYQDETETLQSYHFTGNPREITEQIVDLPENVQLIINERLKELKLALQGKASFRLQIKPHMQGKDRFTRVLLSRATKEKSVRMVELDHPLGNRPNLNVNQILGNQVFTNELEQLTPAIQEQIRTMLHRIRIPTIRVHADSPI